MFEILNNTPKPAKVLKAGLVPYYRDSVNNRIMVCLMVPSDPNYGGTQPQIAKGGIDPGETALQAAKREAWEELGLPESQIVYIHQLSKMQSGKFTWFAAEVKSMDLQPAGHETDKVLWLDLRSAIKQIRDWQRPVLFHLVNFLRN
jgi:8-oxo-dGTP pyrophosphatase MutT (NUDIX family)